MVVPAAFTSSTPPLILPCPSALNTPVRASGVAVRAPATKDSPLVTNTYWPFKLARPYLPTGGGGLTIPLPPLHAAIQRAAATERVRSRRFIAHLSSLPFFLATSLRPGSSRSLWRCAWPRLARPSAHFFSQRNCGHR